MILIQRLLLPKLAFPAPDVMYVRMHDERACLRRDEGLLHFARGARLSFDTYFNGLASDVWKQSCPVDDLSLKLFGRGRVLVRLGFHGSGMDAMVFGEKEVILTAADMVEIPVRAWPTLGHGMLYASITALEDGVLQGGGWYTSSRPRRDVKLAVVITHFNRKQSLTAALQRMQAELQPLPDKHIDFFIVDNSRNLDATRLPGMHVLPNPNLGGSGGFARGLMEAMDRYYTHCLFVDDDAACEAEAIYRIYRLHAFAHDAHTAVAGALLREVEPFRLHEKGACFDRVCRPLKSGLDMRHVPDLLFAQQVEQTPDYGGWWLFSFPLATVKHFPFPFFVRGDDILFGMQNPFRIISSNGIGSWGPDFYYKQGPIQSYLDTRSHLMLIITNADDSFLHWRQIVSCVITLSRYFFSAAISHYYSSACNVRLAIEGACQGREFWLQDMDCAAVRARIAAMEPHEVMQPLHTLTVETVRMPMEEPLLRRLFRWATLNGFLLPSWALSNSTVYQPKHFHGVLRQIFRFRHVLYVSQTTGEGMLMHYDRKRFFRELWLFGKAMLRLLWRYRRLRREYVQLMQDLTTRRFWKDIYAQSNADEKESADGS